MTLHQLAEYLDCSYATVLLLVMRNGLLIFRLGGAGDGWRVRRSDLEKWIAERHVRPFGSGPRLVNKSRPRKSRCRARAAPEMNDADEQPDRVTAIPRAPSARSSTCATPTTAAQGLQAATGLLRPGRGQTSCRARRSRPARQIASWVSYSIAAVERRMGARQEFRIHPERSSRR
jgi:excisionase family DNA binding protein